MTFLSEKGRSLEQQRLDAAVWAAQLRRGLTVRDIAEKEEVETKQIYRDLHAGGYNLAALQAEAIPEGFEFPESPPDSGDERPAWSRLSANDIAFLYRVREEIRAADRVAAYKSRARGQNMD